MADQKTPQPIEFLSAAVPKEFLEVRKLRGREALSRLYHFDLVLKRAAGPLTQGQIDDMLKRPCALSTGLGDHDIVHGIVERLSLMDGQSEGAATYRARVVPSAWLLTLARNNRIFQDMTVAEIVEAIFTEYKLSKGEGFAILVEGGTKHEYVVQYEESDWDFIQRWLEYEGLFYWFEQTAKGAKIIIADANADASPVADPNAISYRDRNSLGTGGEDTVWDWTLDQRRIPARVAVMDHNYRTPHVPLVATANTDTEAGFGSVFFYGEHFKDVDVGKKIAKLRAERIVCSQRTFRATTDCARFRVGHSFELQGHFDSGQDGKYLITAIDHVGGVGDDAGLSQAGRHNAYFEAISMDVPFRPERLTPWPRITGIIHAHVDADSEGDFAEIDDVGRYKVRMPFDTSGATGAKSSRWIRMAQPYAGAGYGTHFPLHKGAEVLVAHIDGNPDRPVIMGAVPCAHTPSPSAAANAHQSVIQTASGIRMELDDQA